jgi:TIR domain/Divergent InlB B-repeat domain
VPTVFISYRREDSPGYAGRLHDHLKREFGTANVFIDVDTLQPGDHFAEAIHKTLSNCDVLLALIGPRWLTAADDQGQPRLEDENDFVRLEIETAFKRNVRTIPVLVERAAMPRAKDLPEPLRPLTMRQAIELADTRWDYDVGKLVRSVARLDQVQQSPVAKSISTQAVEPTSFKGPVGRVGLLKRCRALWVNRAPFGDRQQTFRARDGVWKGYTPRLMRNLPLELGIALLSVMVACVMLFAWLVPSERLLTITRPAGGTISATGIRCGTRGSDCSTSRPKGESIELTPEADAGFAFVGYTGDCAPGGRTIMSAPRLCGATFEAISTVPAVTTQALRIAPVPTGGTLLGIDINCGTMGSVCSASYPAGVPVELHPKADPGFTFMGFVGDCVPLGRTQMTSSRTCSARFSQTHELMARNGGRPGSTPSPSATPPASPTGGNAAVLVPLTDEESSKTKIQDTLKEYCAAQEALDPAAVQRVYPKVDMNALGIQLNKSKYKSLTCKFSDPIFLTLDAAAGTATVQTELRRVFEQAAVIATESSETTAVMTLSRPSPRSPWFIETVTFKKK